MWGRLRSRIKRECAVTPTSATTKNWSSGGTAGGSICEKHHKICEDYHNVTVYNSPPTKGRRFNHETTGSRPSAVDRAAGARGGAGGGGRGRRAQRYAARSASHADR